MARRANKQGATKGAKRRDRNIIAIRFVDADYEKLLARVDSMKPKYVRTGTFLRQWLLEKLGIDSSGNDPATAVHAATG